MVVGYEDGRFSEEEERFEQRGAKPRVILHGDIGFWIELVRSDGQLASCLLYTSDAADE